MSDTGENNIPPMNRDEAGIGTGARAILTAAAAVIVLFGLKEARDLLLPILMAGFLAIISYSITNILRKYLHFPHWLAVTFTVLADIGIITGIGTLIKFLAADMKATLQGEVMQQFVIKYEELLVFLDSLGVGVYARELLEAPELLFNTQQVLAFSQSLTGHILSFTSVTTLVLIMMTFMLGEARLFQKNFRSLPTSLEGKRKVVHALQGIQRYLFIKTVASATTGLLAWWLCAAMNVPFAFLWGFVAYVLNYIPTIGSIVAAIPPILLGLLLGDLSTGLIVAAGYIGINFAIGNGIEPLFLGKQFGIATSVVILSVLLWGWVWGPCGMLLAIPITMLAKLALENSPDLCWIAQLIDDHPAQLPKELVNKCQDTAAELISSNTDHTGAFSADSAHLDDTSSNDDNHN